MCTIDELYVAPEHRGRGHATRLFEGLIEGTSLAGEGVVALELETTPENRRARRLYERLGFIETNVRMRRRIASGTSRDPTRRRSQS